jgi:hypothetical protein
MTDKPIERKLDPERLATWIQNVDLKAGDIIRGKTVSVISFAKSREIAKDLIKELERERK